MLVPGTQVVPLGQVCTHSIREHGRLSYERNEELRKCRQLLTLVNFPEHPLTVKVVGVIQVYCSEVLVQAFFSRFGAAWTDDKGNMMKAETKAMRVLVASMTSLVWFGGFSLSGLFAPVKRRKLGGSAIDDRDYSSEFWNKLSIYIHQASTRKSP